MKKKLSVNLDVEFRSECWNFIRLCILMSDDSYMPWYIEKFNHFFVDETLAFHFYEWNTMEFYSNYDEVLQFDDITDTSKLIETIIEAINNGDYVTLYWDRYYVRGTLQYQKEHKVHGMLVYGYDTDTESISFIDNDINGILWGVNEISYEELLCAFDSAVGIITEEPRQWNWIYQTNLPASRVHLRRDFTRGVRPEAFYTAVKRNLFGGEYADVSRQTLGRISVRRYGISIYKSYYEDLYRILKEENHNYCNEEGKEFILIKLKSLIECKKSFVRKLEYFNKTGIFTFPAELLQGAEQVAELVNKGYLLLSKYTFSFREEILERARSQFMEAQELERTVLEEAKKIMEEQYMFRRLDMKGPKAPRDPEKKRDSFYIMFEKEIASGIMPSGEVGTQIHLNNGRLLASAGIVGGVNNQEIIDMLKTKEGFCRLVHSIGISILTERAEETIEFKLMFYGETDMEKTGTTIQLSIPANGAEMLLKLDLVEWRQGKQEPGQIQFLFDRPGRTATVNVRFYLQDGFTVPEREMEKPVELGTEAYKSMIAASYMQSGNNYRLKRAIEKAKRGEPVTYAFIGASITQGAGAAPITTECYAYKAFCHFRDSFAQNREQMTYIKAGVGGTPSELGMIRFERDVLRDGAVSPDIVVVEFGVNDEGDETRGVCFESLVLKCLHLQSKPAVILLFNVFADDCNLQKRLAPIGEHYRLPMVSIRNAVVEQFRLKSGQGRIVSKSQYFYDMYHPTNTGHTIIADCLNYLVDKINRELPDTEFSLEGLKPLLGDDFKEVRLFDRKAEWKGIRCHCGSFSSVDDVVQSVEMDLNFQLTRQFPYNWLRKPENGQEAFVLEGSFKSLILIYKDSADSNVGRAEVFVDGNYVLTADPHVNGWVHCNPVIVYQADRCDVHRVEIRMEPGNEDKQFTILGFGYVE